MNVFDYLKWRDDLVIDDVNEIDGLIFSRLSYLPLENIMSYSDSLSIKDIYNKLISNKDTIYSNKNDLRLMEVLKDSIRYKDLEVCRVSNKFSEDDEEQFLAITIKLPKNRVFVSFRGTMRDLVGWKENFNMSFMKEVPAQRDGTTYLNGINLFSKIFIGGHSKGGNIAMYAAMHVNNSVKKRIIKIFNYDGPGFMKLDSYYDSVRDKIVSYIPSGSVVGRLMNLDNETIVVKSDYVGILQHDVYNWQLLKNKFIIDSLSEDSNKTKDIIDNWICGMDDNQICVVVNTIYDILKKANIKKINDVSFSELKDIILSIHEIDAETKKMIFLIFGKLFSSAK